MQYLSLSCVPCRTREMTSNIFTGILCTYRRRQPFMQICSEEVPSNRPLIAKWFLQNIMCSKKIMITHNFAQDHWCKLHQTCKLLITKFEMSCFCCVSMQYICTTKISCFHLRHNKNNCFMLKIEHFWMFQCL